MRDLIPRDEVTTMCEVYHAIQIVSTYQRLPEHARISAEKMLAQARKDIEQEMAARRAAQKKEGNHEED